MSHTLKFGGKLKLLREAADLSISEAETISGMRDGRWEELESGEHEPRTGDFIRALVALRVKNYRVFKPEDFERVAP